MARRPADLSTINQQPPASQTIHLLISRDPPVCFTRVSWFLSKNKKCAQVIDWWTVVLLTYHERHVSNVYNDMITMTSIDLIFILLFIKDIFFHFLFFFCVWHLFASAVVVAPLFYYSPGGAQQSYWRPNRTSSFIALALELWCPFAAAAAAALKKKKRADYV